MWTGTPHPEAWIQQREWLHLFYKKIGCKCNAVLIGDSQHLNIPLQHQVKTFA